MPRETLADLGPRPLPGLEDAYKATMAERMRLPPQISAPMASPTQPMPVRPMPVQPMPSPLGMGAQMPLGGGMALQGQANPMSLGMRGPTDWAAMLRYQGGGR